MYVKFHDYVLSCTYYKGNNEDILVQCDIFSQAHVDSSHKKTPSAYLLS